jgi:hypothetical protein
MRLFCAALVSTAALVAGTTWATAEELSTPATQFSTLAFLKGPPDAPVILTIEQLAAVKGTGVMLVVEPVPGEEVPTVERVEPPILLSVRVAQPTPTESPVTREGPTPGG